MRKKVVACLLLAGLGLGVLGLAACGSSSSGTSSSKASGGARTDMTTVLTKALDALVDKGTITSAQETKIVAAVKSAMPSGQGQPGQGQSGGQTQASPPSGQTQGSPPAMPSGGSGQSMPGGQSGMGGGMFTSALKTLVSKGVITAKQEKAVAAALQKAMGGGKGGGQPGGMQPSASPQST